MASIAPEKILKSGVRKEMQRVEADSWAIFTERLRFHTDTAQIMRRWIERERFSDDIHAV